MIVCVCGHVCMESCVCAGRLLFHGLTNPLFGNLPGDNALLMEDPTKAQVRVRVRVKGRGQC